jgi:hypothetical protein
MEETNARTQWSLKTGIQGVEYENSSEFKERNLKSVVWEL